MVDCETDKRWECWWWGGRWLVDHISHIFDDLIRMQRRLSMSSKKQFKLREERENRDWSKYLPSHNLPSHLPSHNLPSYHLYHLTQLTTISHHKQEKKTIKARAMGEAESAKLIGNVRDDGRLWDGWWGDCERERDVGWFVR